MKCKYCHAEIDNDSVFCPNCGKKLTEPAPRSQNKPKPSPKRREVQKKDYPKAWWLILLVALLCIGVYLLFFHSCEGKRKAQEQEETEVLEKKKAAEEDSAYQAKAVKEQQLLQDSLVKVAKAKTDSLEQLKKSLKEAKETHTSKKKRSLNAEGTPTVHRPSTTVTRSNASLVVGTKNLGYGTFNGTLRNGLPHDVNGRLIFKRLHLIDSHDPKGRIAEAGDYVIGEFSDGHLVHGIWYGADRQVKGSIIIGK